MKKIFAAILFMVVLIPALAILQNPAYGLDILNRFIYLFSKSIYFESGEPNPQYSVQNILVEFYPVTTKTEEEKILSSFGRIYTTNFPHKYKIILKPGLESVDACWALDKFSSVEGAEPKLQTYPKTIHSISVTFKPSTKIALKNKILRVFGNIDKTATDANDTYEIALKNNFNAGIVVKQLMKLSVVEKAYPIFPAGFA
jgi:hypothetical protein